MPIRSIIIKLTVFMLVALGLASCNSRDCITKFAENNEVDKQIYVYPSTLEMINKSESEILNDLFKDFELGQYFVLDNTAENVSKIEILRAKMLAKKYSEIASFSSANKIVTVYSLEQNPIKTAAIFTTDSTINIIQVTGAINYLKIPELMHSENYKDVLSIFEFINTKINTENLESHPEHQHHK